MDNLLLLWFVNVAVALAAAAAAVKAGCLNFHLDTNMMSSCECGLPRWTCSDTSFRANSKFITVVGTGVHHARQQHHSQTAAAPTNKANIACSPARLVGLALFGGQSLCRFLWHFVWVAKTTLSTLHLIKSKGKSKSAFYDCPKSDRSRLVSWANGFYSAS